jgi:SAM-dependent methyltransferase
MHRFMTDVRPSKGARLIFRHRAFRLLIALCFVPATAGFAAESSDKPYEPTVGQAGKDTVWVPTPISLVEKMLDLAKVTPRDYVMDLGSGDGRNVIAAAKRGARAHGVEYNPDMVELSRRTAEKEGVADKATFSQGDMFEADISQANVMALFLLPDNMRRLTPKFLAMKPGSRIVANAFGIDGWEPDKTERAEGECGSWCTALLFIVPAKVEGTWKLPQGELALEQKFQMISGTLDSGGKKVPITNGRMNGEEITFTAGNVTYVGQVKGNTMQGRTKGASNGAWTASRSDL